MNNKLNNMINEFLENVDVNDERGVEELLQEFTEKYNSGDYVYENTIMDDAYELLEKADRAKSKKQAKKYAKEAYEMCPDCFDAVLLLAELEDDFIKRWEILNEGLEFEKDRLEEEGYFEKDNIGNFYLIFETRPYIRGLCIKANLLLIEGKVKQARDVCLEILRLNENDNTGARYLLMAIYAYLEEEKDMLKLYKKYPEEDLEMLFPLFALYFKLGNEEKAKEYFDRIKKANKHFVKFFKDKIEEDLNVPAGYFEKGGSSEVIMYFNKYDFLIDTMQALDCYVLKYDKMKK